MNVKAFASKLSVVLALTLLVSLMLPVLVYAAATVDFYYDSSTGKLTGKVYVNDPNKVQVNVTNSVYQSTPLASNGGYVDAGYDDNNVPIKIANYEADLGTGNAPSKIEANACGRTFTATLGGSYNQTKFYSSAFDWRIGPKRMTAVQHFTDYPSGTPLPAGAKMVEFTPNVGSLNGIEVDLPDKELSNTVVGATYGTSDFELKDVTVGEAVYLNRAVKIYDSSLQFNTNDALVSGHNYLLKLSDTSRTSINLKPENSAGIRVSLGTYDNQGWLLVQNRAYFDNLNFNNVTTNGSAVTHTGVHPLGDMSTCGGTSGSDGGGTAPIPTPGVEDNNNGVKLDSSAATVTKVTGADGKSVTKVTLDPAKLGLALGLLKNKDKGAQTVTFATGTSEGSVTVELPADLVAAAAKDTPDAIVSIQSGDASFDLPVSLLNLAAAAQTLGTDLKDVKVQVSIDKITGATADTLVKSAQTAGVKLLGDAVDYSVSLTAGDKTLPMNDFGGVYVTRTLVVPGTVSSNDFTGVLYDPPTGMFTFVPALFVVNGDKTEVKIKRTGNSIYAVANVKKSFDDIKGHWAQSDIELLASKLVVNGKSDTAYAPEDSVTRAEFAALIVRALGLSPEKTAGAFPDVQAADWYTGYVAAAVKAGVVNGFENGAFRPNDTITREQMAVMVSRAMAFAGKMDDTSETAATAQLSVFNDQGAISGWARTSIAQTLRSGIVNGMGSDSYAPQEKATRAQAVVMLKRMLAELKFIN